MKTAALQDPPVNICRALSDAPSLSPSLQPSSMPTLTPPQVMDFHLVNAARLYYPRQGRMDSSQTVVDPVYTHMLDFDWQSMKHNRVQVEIEVETFANSVLVSTNDGPSVCVDTSLVGTRVGSFNNGNLTEYYPIEVGVHSIKATAFTDKDCLAGPGPTAMLKLTDKKGQEGYLQPGSRVCMVDSTIEAMVVSCTESNYQVRAVQHVRFRLKDRDKKMRQPKFGYFKDETGPFYSATFDLNTGSKYRLMADVKLEGLGKKSVLNKNFKTNGCDEL